MNELLHLIIKSAIDSFNTFTSPSLFTVYIFISFSAFRSLADQAKTTEGKLKMWQYNSYALVLLFIAMQFSMYIRNSPDKWQWAVIALALLVVLLYLKTKRLNYKKID
jgi:L-asparagine transporter-like permease